jgi:hypothetical protein
VKQNFGYGMYEGIAGLVTKPMEGHKKEGTLGLLKGLGKAPIELVTQPGSGKEETLFIFIPGFKRLTLSVFTGKPRWAS